MWSEQDHLECAPFGILGHTPRNEVVGSQGVYTFCFYGNFKRNLLIKVTLFTEVLLIGFEKEFFFQNILLKHFYLFDFCF